MPCLSHPLRSAAAVKSAPLSVCTAAGSPQTGQVHVSPLDLSQLSLGRMACDRHRATEVEDGASIER